jgi:hypothetical protein
VSCTYRAHLTKPLCNGRPNTSSPGALKHSDRNMPRDMHAVDWDRGSLQETAKDGHNHKASTSCAMPCMCSNFT